MIRSSCGTSRVGSAVRSSRAGGAAASVAALAISIATGSASADTLVPAEAVHATAQCPLAGAESSLGVIESSAQWSSLLSADARSLFGREVLWDRERVVVFALARQNTLGHKVELSARLFEERAGVLTMPVRIQRPAPDRMSATALSRPCLIVSVQRDGWRTVRVTEARGRVLASGSAAR